MSLSRGLVLSLDRRALLAALAIAISVGYALVAGATVGGLKDAQSALGSDVQDPWVLAEREDGSSFALDEVPGQPDHGVAHFERPDVEHPLYTVRGGPLPVENASRAFAGPGTGLEDGQTVEVGLQELVVETGEAPPGAQAGWLGLDPDTFDEAGGSSAPQVDVAVYDDVDEETRAALEQEGYAVREAPSAVGFYVGGVEGLVSAIGVTVASSTVVVGLLASGFVAMELRAKRQSLATVQMYGGPGLVRKIVLARGAVLLAAGHAIAVGLTWGLIELVTRASALDIGLDPVFAGATVAATLVGGLLGLAPPIYRASSRLEAERLTERSPPAWLPSFLRPTLTSWRIVVPLFASAVILAASLGVIFGIVDLPTQLFGVTGGEVIASPGGNPLRGSVDPFEGRYLGQVDGFSGSSAEIFAPTTIGSTPVMVRGASWSSLQSMAAIEVEQGRAYEGPGEAVAGTRLAQRADIQVGETVRIASAYTATTHRLEIVGVASSPSLVGDELVVGLESARAMTKLAPDKVHVVRFDREPTAGVADGDRPLPEGIEVTGLSVFPRDPVPFQEATVTAELVNFGRTTQTRQVTLHVNGEPVADAWPTVGPRQTGTVELDFRVPGAGLVDLQINPSEQVQTGEPAYRIEALDAVTLNSTFDVDVRTQEGEPASDVEVRLGDSQATTDADGRARIQATRLGNQTIAVEGPEGRGAKPIRVVAPGDLYRPRVVVTTVQGPEHVRPGERWEGVVGIENVGGQTFNGTVPIPVDNRTEPTSRVLLPPGASRRIGFSLDLDRGEHTIGPNGSRVEVTVRPGAPTAEGDDEALPANLTVDELLELRRERAQTASGAGQSATQAFLSDTFENLNAALTIVTLATVLHAGLVTVVAVFREIEDRSSAVGTFNAVGADRGSLRIRAAREFATVGLPAALLGTGVGLALAYLAATAGILTGFGHALFPRTSLGFVLRVAVASAATTVVVAVVAVDQARERSASDLLAQGPRRSRRPPLDTLIGGSE